MGVCVDQEGQERGERPQLSGCLAQSLPDQDTRLLTDNGEASTDRLFASRERKPSGNHEFDVLCQDLGIEHRLTTPRSPQTNAMVERFNGQLGNVQPNPPVQLRPQCEQDTASLRGAL